MKGVCGWGGGVILYRPSSREIMEVKEVVGRSPALDRIDEVENEV